MKLTCTRMKQHRSNDRSKNPRISSVRDGVKERAGRETRSRRTKRRRERNFFPRRVLHRDRNSSGIRASPSLASLSPFLRFLSPPTPARRSFLFSRNARFASSLFTRRHRGANSSSFGRGPTKPATAKESWPDSARIFSTF